MLGSTSQGGSQFGPGGIGRGYGPSQGMRGPGTISPRSATITFVPAVRVRGRTLAESRRTLLRSFPQNGSAARSFLLLPAASRDTGPDHGAERSHFFRILRSRAIFRFIAADPLPVPAFPLDFLRRRGAAAFAFFFARRRVPPLLIPPFVNTDCCAGVSCANPAKPPGGGYLQPAMFTPLRVMRVLRYQHDSNPQVHIGGGVSFSCRRYRRRLHRETCPFPDRAALRDETSSTAS